MGWARLCQSERPNPLKTARKLTNYLQANVNACDAIVDVESDLAFVQGALGPAQSVQILRQLATVTNKAVLDLQALYDAIPTCEPRRRVKV